MSNEISSHTPPDVLESQAAEQRKRIHQSISELRFSVRETVRERLDAKAYARTHIWQLIGGATAVAFVLGHGFAGMFTRH